jgi:2-oxoglutarate ferredoxin oxidoreductase subunit beta
MIKAAISHPGFAFLDVISPCVTFNNNPGSTKSYDFVREHMEATAAIDYVPPKTQISVDYAEGKSAEVTLHDGSSIHLSKLAPHWNPQDRNSAVNRLQVSKDLGEVLTGLLYIDPQSRDLHDLQDTVRTPLNQLGEVELCPGSESLAKINAAFR